jgi:hypothetical protein
MISPTIANRPHLVRDVRPRPQWNHCAGSKHRLIISLDRSSEIGPTIENTALVARVITVKRQMARAA